MKIISRPLHIDKTILGFYSREKQSFNLCIPEFGLLNICNPDRQVETFPTKHDQRLLTEEYAPVFRTSLSKLVEKQSCHYTTENHTKQTVHCNNHRNNQTFICYSSGSITLSKDLLCFLFSPVLLVMLIINFC